MNEIYELRGRNGFSTVCKILDVNDPEEMDVLNATVKLSAYDAEEDKWFVTVGTWDPSFNGYSTSPSQ